MRRVVNSDQVAHLWANQSQSDARNSQGNFSFDGPLLWSYRALIAAIHRTEDGNVVLFSSSYRGYSNTTARHYSRAAYAAHHLSRFFYVPNVDPNGREDYHSENLTHLVSVFTVVLAKYGRAREHAGWREREATSAADAARDYARLFNLPAPAVDFDAELARVTAERSAAAARRNTPAAVAKRERARVRKAERIRANFDGEVLRIYGSIEEFAFHVTRLEEEKRARQLAHEMAKLDAIARWRAGDSVPSYSLLWDTPTMLRARGQVVQTSRGAEVPLAHARRLFAIVAATRARGEEWVPNGHTLHIGAFTVARIAADGTLTAGCHTIEWGEIETFARAQGWLVSDAGEVAR